jgi:hypothetical protein
MPSGLCQPFPCLSHFLQKSVYSTHGYWIGVSSLNWREPQSINTDIKAPVLTLVEIPSWLSAL